MNNTAPSLYEVTNVTVNMVAQDKKYSVGREGTVRL